MPEILEWDWADGPEVQAPSHNRLTKLIREEYIPAVVAQPARPAYCTYVPERVRVVRVINGGAYVRTYIGNQAGGIEYGSGTLYSYDPATNTLYSNGQSVTLGGQQYQAVTTFETVMREVCYPATEGVEGRDAVTTYDNQLGWDAGAHSIRFLDGEVGAAFEMSKGAQGILCGLASPFAKVGEFNAVEHGLYCANGAIGVVESGSLVLSSGIEPAPGLRLLIQRIGGEVHYTVGPWTYTSTVPSCGYKMLLSSIYCAEDYVDNPSLYVSQKLPQTTMEWDWSSRMDESRLTVASSWDWGDGRVPRMSWDWNGSATPSTIIALRAHSTWDWGGAVSDAFGYTAMSLELLLKGGDADFNEVRLVLDPLTVSANDYPSVETSAIAWYATLFMGAMDVLVSADSASGDLALSMQTGDYEYGFGRLDFGEDAFYLYSADDPSEDIEVTEILVLAEGLIDENIVFVVVQDGLGLSTSAELSISFDISIFESLALHDEISLTAIVELLISEGLALNDSVGLLNRQLLQYATNLVTGAVSTYSGFGFQGFATAGQQPYAWRSDGIYRIGANTDDGLPMDALVEFAAEDFQTNQRKRLSDLFLGLRTDGQVFVRLVNDDGVERVYQAPAMGHMHRARLGKGDASRFWTLQITLEEATEAELDSIEWVAGASSRRIRR